jgi:glycosyltransferase involved in cell wall biosynthesis
MEANSSLRVVLVHDWLTGMRGGEKCLEYFCRRWPEAPLYTLLRRRGSVSKAIENRPVRTSFLQWLPRVHRYYRYLLPLMPSAVRWRLPACDLVLSSSHCVAKSVRPPEGVPHVCYCFTPMRYAWHMQKSYFGEQQRSLKGWARRRLLARIRNWDQRTAANVTHFVAISRTVQQRIRDCYGRSSVVIYPPVDTDFYHPAPVPRENYYLVVSAFAPYKRIDLAVEACNRLNRQLVIIGKGQDEKRLRALAGPTVHFLGWQPNEAIRDHLRRCRALLFPGEEDFGIVPVEAQACGTPVIAFGRGGATETIVPPERSSEPTGLWFGEQSAECLGETIQRFEAVVADLSPDAIRRQALHFHGERFAREIFGYIDEVLGRMAPPVKQAA